MDKIPATFTHVFIGKPVYRKGQLLEALEKWEREGPPPPMHDATIFANRHYVAIEEVEIVQGPDYMPGLHDMDEEEDGKRGFDIVVRFPLEYGAFKLLDTSFAMGEGSYGERACGHMDTLLVHPYVVLGGYQVYEDYGNSDRFPGTWDDLGIDPAGPHKGFDTLDEAREYASRLESTSP